MEKCYFNDSESDVQCSKRVGEGMCVGDCWECELGMVNNDSQTNDEEF